MKYEMKWNYMLTLWHCRQSGQIRRKTCGPGTHNHAFRGHLLYHWATSPYWTSRLTCHMVELEVSSCLIHYCQLRVIQLVSLVCWRVLDANTLAPRLSADNVASLTHTFKITWVNSLMRSQLAFQWYWKYNGKRVCWIYTKLISFIWKMKV